jgi:hypothetical protein
MQIQQGERTMNTAEILDSLNREIGNLQKARTILAGKPVRRVPRGHGPDAGKLPRGWGTFGKVKRSISAQGRKNIAAAQRKRWAKQKAA